MTLEKDWAVPVCNPKRKGWSIAWKLVHELVHAYRLHNYYKEHYEKRMKEMEVDWAIEKESLADPDEKVKAGFEAQFQKEASDFAGLETGGTVTTVDEIRKQTGQTELRGSYDVPSPNGGPPAKLK